MDYLKLKDNHIIQEDDICVIYVSESQRYILNIKPSEQLQTKFGQVRAVDLIGWPYGIRYECKKGWILPLRLTPELWTQILPHRTQILYQADISMILLQLDIKPGSIIVESGTGSGSLSHSLLRACRPNGYLHTYEINESRAREALNDFHTHGFINNVQVYTKNVYEEGFNENLNGVVDACILDLPQTWEAIDHAFKVMKPTGSRLCTFSPCIEQVKQNVAKMSALKMRDIITLETLTRPREVKILELRKWNDDVLNKLTAIDEKRFDNLKNSIIVDTNDTSGDNQVVIKMSDNLEASHDSNDEATQLTRALNDPKAPFHPHMLPKEQYAYPKEFSETVSHSGYLTFATKRP